MEKPRTGHTIPYVTSPGQGRGAGSPSSTCWPFFFNVLLDTMGLLATKAHCWLTANLLSTRTPRSFSAELLSSRSSPNLYWCMRLLLLKCKTLHWALVKLQVPSCPTLQTALVLFNSSTAFWCVSHSSQLPIISKLTECGLFVPSSRLLMKMLNKTGPSTDPWGTP